MPPMCFRSVKAGSDELDNLLGDEIEETTGGGERLVHCLEPRIGLGSSYAVKAACEQVS